jgi:hypothetical protein
MAEYNPLSCTTTRRCAPSIGSMASIKGITSLSSGVA